MKNEMIMKANNSKNTMFAKRFATMLVAILIMGVGSAVGATTGQINFGNNGTKINGTSVNGNDSQNNEWDVTTVFESTTSFTQQSNFSQVGSSGTPASSITFTMTLPAKKKITAFSAKFGGFSGTAGSVALKVDNVTIGSGSLNASSDVTVSNSSQAVGKELKVTVTGISKGVKCYYVSYTYETPVPHTVTFNPHFGTFDNPSALGEGNTIAESSGAEGVTLPAVTPYADGWGFYGWASTACAEETADVPTIVGKAGETYYPAADETLHAVFAKGEYIRITNADDLIAGKNYLIVANNNGNNYLMTNEYSTYENGEDKYGQLAGKQLDETNSTNHTYSAASIYFKDVFSIVTSASVNIETGDWMIKNVVDNKYVSVDYQNMYLALDDMTEGSDGNYIRLDNGTWKISNHYAEEANKLYYNASENMFRKDQTTATALLIYKETSTPKYYSNPCSNVLSLSAINASTATLALSKTSIITCGADEDRQVTITATPATGYTFTESARLTYAGDGTATHVSGPTANNDAFDFVYQFSQDAHGDGEFSVSSATPKTYTITLNGNGGTGNTANVTATYNSASLSSAITNPEKTHCVFNGWYSGEGGTGSLIINKNGALQANVDGYTGANSIWTRDEATTLYAKWTEHTYTNYRTRCCNLDVVTNVYVSATTDNSVTLSWTAPADKTGITGYQVVYASNGEVAAEVNDANATSATVTSLTECETYNFRVASVNTTCKNTSDVIEAVPFEGAKTITFDYNGGSGSLASFVTACGSKTVTLPAPDDREGYTFSGWYNGDVLIGTAGEDYTPSTNITLKAKYTEIPRYSITLKALGQTHKVIANKLMGSTVWTLIKDEKAPSMSGYAFLGWSIAPDNEGAILNSVSTNTLTDDLTLYAIYKKANYEYRKVTATEDVTSGDYLIVCETGNVAFNGGINSSDFDITNNKIDVEISNDYKIASNDATEAAKFIITTTSDDSLTIQSATGYYIGRTTNSTGITTSNSNGLKHKVEIDSESDSKDVTIKASNIYVLRFNDANNQLRFRYYATSASCKPIQLYKKVALLEGDAISVPTLTIEDGSTIAINDMYPDGKAGNIIVKDGGKMVTSSAIQVNNFTIEGTQGSSGQVTNAQNLTINGDAYFEFTLAVGGDDLPAREKANRQWHNFSVPFPVSALDGVYGYQEYGHDGVWSWDKLTNEVDYAIEDYHGEIRAQGKYGWKKFRGTMQPGITYSMTVTGYALKFRFKKVAGNYTFAADPSVDFAENAISGDGTTTDAGWNGLGNMRLCYASIDNTDILLDEGVRYVQVLDAESYTYQSHSISSINFTVGSAFFIQAANDGAMHFNDAQSATQLYAPKRIAAKQTEDILVTLSDGEHTDNLYVSANEDATNEYQIGHDLLKMFATNTPQAPMLYTTNYGMKLSAEEAPIVNNQATFVLNLYAPANGEYTIAVPTATDAQVYLTKNGKVIWNLSMSECELDLTKGDNEGYGLKIVAAPKVSTGVENGELLNGANGVQKVIIDEHVFILRDGQMYDVTGKMVK